jgi:hypothetical protein
VNLNPVGAEAGGGFDPLAAIFIAVRSERLAGLSTQRMHALASAG